MKKKNIKIVNINKYYKLNSLYNASDFGILLRENRLVNNVASPTKFAEYIMAGLKVIISENVGDYSEIVTKNNYGFVVTSSDLEDLRRLQQVILDKINSDYCKPNEISKYGNDFLSKQVLKKKMLIGIQ